MGRLHAALLSVLLVDVWSSYGYLPCPDRVTDDAASRQTFCDDEERGTPQALPLDQQYECCAKNIPPIKLLDTGSTIIDPQSQESMDRFRNASCALGATYESCVNPPPVYRKYSNYYTQDFRNGILILSQADAENITFESVRSNIGRLLEFAERRWPDIEEYMSRAFVRVLIRSCANPTWIAHPDANRTNSTIELGGGNRDTPSVGVEESGVPGTNCFELRYPVELEEFFHTIHDIVIQTRDPDAFDAIVCIAARDSGNGLFAFDEYYSWRNLTVTKEERFGALLRMFDSFVETVQYEYFIQGIAIWMGLPMGPFSVNGTFTRAAIKQHLPDLACLIARYIPDVGETDGEFCALQPDGGDEAEEMCHMNPGSCFCGRMTDAYLGPPLNKNNCPSLREIKERSGYMTRDLPGTGRSREIQCRGCQVEGCENDRGILGSTSTASSLSWFLPHFITSTAVACLSISI